MKIPVSLLIDDPTPVISSFYLSAVQGTTNYQSAKLYQQTADGRPLIKKYPNSLLLEFVSLIEGYGIKGKLSIIPSPHNTGNIVDGITDVTREELDEWIDIVKGRVEGNFTVGPEMLTHGYAVDLETGRSLDVNEHIWSQAQDRTTLTPYIKRALSLLCEAGFDAFGVTSPWQFGINVEDEYAAAISRAVYEVTGKTEAWYFLRGLRGVPDAKPWVQLEEEGRILVSIPATTSDVFWQTMDTERCDEEYISSIADMLITKDGKGGQIISVLETGGYPIIIAHWQSLMSNGLGTGLRILEEVALRIKENLSDRVEWMSFEEIMHLVIENKKDYPRRIFN